jgi:hypothetical protein
MTTGGEEGAGATSLDSSNVDIQVENTEMTNMVADSNATRGRTTMNFALLLVAVEEGDRISLRQITTTDAQEGRTATAAMMDTETTTIPRREGATGEIEGEVGGVADVVTMTAT